MLVNKVTIMQFRVHELMELMSILFFIILKNENIRDVQVI